MHIWITIILSIILLILLLSAIVHKCQGKLTVSRFFNIEAKNAYPTLVKELGQPQIVVNQPGGFVMWFPRQSDPSIPFSNVILKDEQILHTIPHQHYDFLYTSVIINIPEKDLVSTLSVSKSLYYDRVTRELTIRCNSLAANKAIIYAVLQRLTNPVVWNASIAHNIEQQILESIINNDGSVNATKSLNGCILKQLDTININNRDLERLQYNQIERFVPRAYKQIPVAP